MISIKSILKKTFIYKIYRTIIDARHKKKFKKDCQLLQEFGDEILKQFDTCMKELNIPYTLGFGTLLGAVREHGFIMHDDDIDYTMWIDDYRPEMINALDTYGFKLIHSYSVENDTLGKEDTFEYKGILVDIFYIFKPVNKLPYCCWFVNHPHCTTRQSIKSYGGLFTRRIEIPIDKKTIQIPFRNLELPIPSKYREILICRYGNDYMIPKPGFKPSSDYIIDWPGKIGILKTYK